MSIFISFASTIITALAVILVDWLKSDAKLESFDHVIDESTKIIGFLNAWTSSYEAVQKLPEGEQRNNARELADLALTDVLHRKKYPPVAVTSRLKYLARFVRLDVPDHPFVWVPQLAFYAAATMFFLAFRNVGRLNDPGVMFSAGAVFLFWATTWVLDRLLYKTRK